MQAKEVQLVLGLVQGDLLHLLQKVDSVVASTKALSQSVEHLTTILRLIIANDFLVPTDRPGNGDMT